MQVTEIQGKIRPQVTEIQGKIRHEVTEIQGLCAEFHFGKVAKCHFSEVN